MSGNKMTLFDIYGDIGLPIDLVILNVIRIVFSTFGILFNASLVFVTAKTKTLKSSCHLLIAFDCLVSSFYQINSWLSITVIFNAGNQFLQIRPCCLEMLPAFLFGFTASFISTYLISFDRLLSVLFPMCKVICAPHESSSFAWAYRILKTLSVLMILNLIGFSMNSIVRLIVPRFELDVTQRTILIHALSCLTNLVMASNAPILFIFNQDYRRAFQKVFNLKKFSVTSVTAVAITPNDAKKCTPKNVNNNNKNMLTPIN
uniref:G-protein coupled receptors family 1 profile domain-containing protein n=1 Tax=Meloidogyne javanica TaxID=6303 RepID=A0A915MME4_MELJA